MKNRIMTIHKTWMLAGLLTLSAFSVQAATVKIDSVAASGVKPTVFTVSNPDYVKSPYTGMTRKHWIDAAKYLLDGAFSYIHNLDDEMYFPKQLDKTYPRSVGQIGVAKLEGLCRTLFVAAPLLRENPDLQSNGVRVADYYRYHLINMTNPKSASYVEKRKGGPSQTMLELGALCISLKTAQDVLWNPLTKAQRDSLAALFLSYGEGPTIGSNWRFFNVFILSFLKDQGYKVNEQYLEMNITKLLERYSGHGWYNDAPAYDYYSMWAYQTYGPLWAELFGNRMYPRYAAQFMDNLHDIIGSYPYMFNEQGRMNMWGRSIPYRFASVSPLSFLEYDKSGEANYGWLRHISSATLLQFMQHPDFLDDGIPTMGFYGQFAPAVQIYSCRGSVYWCGKAFFCLLLPEKSKFWSATENNGAWEEEMEKGKVYNRFQPGSNLLITDYPNSGGAEMRSWCHETVAKDWQKFRSSENYNKLAYHTEFPWMADGKNGEISMNYGTKNRKGAWEVLRLYTFKDFADGVYRRDAVLETDTMVRYQLADIPLPDGVLRIDKVSVPSPTDIRLGSYSLPTTTVGLPSEERSLGRGRNVTILSNGEYSLAVVPLSGWDRTSVLTADGLHPVSKRCGLIVSDAHVSDSRIFVSLQLWKRGAKTFTNGELSCVKSVKISKDQHEVEVTLSDGTRKRVTFR